ncbi:MAG: glycosyltransferase, partial [Nitrospirota bacterium]
LARMTLNRIRNWDRRTADRVSHFIANSRYIAERINRAYGRTAHVVYPPVDTNLFTLHREKEDFYLAVSRMVPYKRMDVIVEAFANMPDKRLLVIGEGPESAKVREKAAGARNVQILGYRPLEEMRDYMQRARAFVFAAEEDFGIVAVEAQACGTPVIAYGKGGASETVIPGRTGVFFEEQSSESLSRAVEYFEHARKDMDPEEIRRHAEKFSAERFRMEFRDYVENCLSRRGLS